MAHKLQYTHSGEVLMNLRIDFKQIFLVIAILSIAALNAFAGPEDGSNLDINPNDYVVESPTDVDAKIKVIPHKDPSNFSVQVQLPTSTFIIAHPPAEQLEFYQNLSEGDKVKFHQKRLIGLATLAKALPKVKKGLGFGSLVKEKIMFWKKKNEENKSFSERSDKVVEAVLRGFDAKAWESAPIFADLKELGFTGIAQIVATAGTNKEIKTKSIRIPEIKTGGAIGVGFTIGVNFEQRSLVFQLFNANEQLKEVYLPLFYLAGNLKAGMYVSSSQQKLYSSQKGEGFYPFAAPGYVDSAPEKKSFGGTFAFGIPTSPIDAGLTFKTNMQEQSYLRVSISPFTWKFLSINFKNPLGLIKVTAKNIPELFLEFRRLYRLFFATKSCGGLFATL